MGAYKLNQPKQNTKTTEQSPEENFFKKTRFYYKELQILKFPDLLYLRNCLFMSQIEANQKSVNSFADLKHCSDSHNYQTKSKTKGFFDIPHLNTEIYDT